MTEQFWKGRKKSNPRDLKVILWIKQKGWLHNWDKRDNAENKDPIVVS